MKAFKTLAVALTTIALTACTVHKADEAPPLTGPSGAATSVSLTASPDSITHDGGSQSRITITVFGPDGKPLSRPPSLRLDMFVNGIQQDYGTLSARTAVPNGNGESVVVYTAPPPPPGSIFGTCNGLAGTCVEIVATPIGTNFEAISPQSVLLRLMPPGVILPPAGTPTAAFTFSPQPATAFLPVRFDASTSQAGAGSGGISSYGWSFGDGDTATGMNVTHTFDAESSYNVTLTVTNDRGLTASRTQAVSVGSAGLPTPVFTVSPSAPTVGQQVFFNASTSTPGAGGAISSYTWTFGDGTTGSGTSVTHIYPTAGSYIVQLTVTDAAGLSATSGGTTVSVSAPGGGTVVAPAATFTVSPSAPGVGETVFFNASTSTAGTGHTISSYAWTFGDGGTATGVSPTHAYATAGTYSVQLTITNEVGQPTLSGTQSISAGSSAGPSANFTFSPLVIDRGDQVIFDASSSTTPQGTTIVDVAWNFGDDTPVIHCPGSPAAVCPGPTNRISTHIFQSYNTFVVNLVVTDSAGRIGSTFRSVSVTPPVPPAPPVAAFTFSPPNPGVGAGTNLVSFDASTSTAGTAPITNYRWNFGDGTIISGAPANPAPAPGGTLLAPRHTFAAGSFTVTLTVTNANGSGSTTSTVTVVP